MRRCVSISSTRVINTAMLDAETLAGNTGGPHGGPLGILDTAEVFGVNVVGAHALVGVGVGEGEGVGVGAAQSTHERVWDRMEAVG
jgi:hypothetical protein